MAWLPLCGTVLVLGLRHGLDADHLAAIDSLTRYNSVAAPPLARRCGLLFALGHGTVVLLVAGIAGSAMLTLRVPAWLTGAGALTSIALLTALGVLNLRAVLSTPSAQPVRLTGLRSLLFLRLTRTCRPLGIAAIGALFAISFDTLSQAVLFATTAARAGGLCGALALGGVFAAGMALVDGLNGRWVARLLGSRDRRAYAASRAVASLVAGSSFAIAALGLLRYVNPAADSALSTYDTAIGLLLALVVAGALVVLGRRRDLRSAAEHGCASAFSNRVDQPRWESDGMCRAARRFGP